MIITLFSNSVFHIKHLILQQYCLLRQCYQTGSTTLELLIGAIDLLHKRYKYRMEQKSLDCFEKIHRTDVYVQM